MTWHVPEHLRITNKRDPMWSLPGKPFGTFHIPVGAGRVLRALACDGVDEPDDPIPEEALGWEHVSVSAVLRGGISRPKLPIWDEMCTVKDLFWGPEDVVVQFHPAKSEYVDDHPVLHLWRYILAEFPTPNPLMVGYGRKK